jgi:hypothetical protein
MCGISGVAVCAESGVVNKNEIVANAANVFFIGSNFLTISSKKS